MKKFLLKISLVLVPFAFSICCLAYLAYNSEVQIFESDISCPTNVLAAVVGDSRVNKGFDPTEITWLRNFGSAGMSFMTTMEKAKRIARLNPNIKLLIIDVNPGRFVYERISEPLIKQNPWEPPGTVLINIMAFRDMPPLCDGDEVRFVNWVLIPYFKRLLFKHFLFKHYSTKSPITGGFEQYHRFMTDSHIKDQTRPIETRKICTDCENKLDRLLNYLRFRNINVVLCSMPVYHWSDWDQIPEDAKTYFVQRMRQISKKHNVPWLNWLSDDYNNADYWGDNSHLNDIGAKVFSRDKRSILEQHLRPTTPK